jgi:hypothetical protein
MICLAMAAPDAFLVGLAVGMVIGGVAAFVITVLDPDPAPAEAKHHCPYCGETLRAVTVQDVEEPLPDGTKWVCPDCDPMCWFADADRSPAGKPAPIEEV